MATAILPCPAQQVRDWWLRRRLLSLCSIQSISLISGGAVLRVTTVSHLRLDVLGLLFGLVNSSRGDDEVLSVLNGTQTKGTKCQFCVCALWRTKPLSENPCEDSFALFPLMLSETLNSGLQVDHSCPPFPQTTMSSVLQLVLRSTASDLHTQPKPRFWCSRSLKAREKLHLYERMLE